MAKTKAAFIKMNTTFRSCEMLLKNKIFEFCSTEQRLRCSLKRPLKNVKRSKCGGTDAS